MINQIAFASDPSKRGPPWKSDLDRRRDDLLGMATWSARRLVACEADYYRHAIRARAGDRDARIEAERDHLHCLVFAASLAEDMANSTLLGVGVQGRRIAEAAAGRIVVAREDVAAEEAKAGLAIPRIPVACAGSAPWAITLIKED